MRTTYAAGFDTVNNLLQVKEFDPDTLMYNNVASQIDNNLPLLFPVNGQEPLHMSAADNGPQVLVAWINSLGTSIQFLFYTGSEWVYASQALATNEIAQSLHTAVSPRGIINMIGYITTNAVTGLTNAFQITIDSAGAVASSRNIGSITSSTNTNPRIRIASPDDINPFVVFGLGDGNLTYSYSPSVGTWTPHGITGPFDTFDFGSGPNATGYLATSSIISNGTNAGWTYYTTNATGPTFVNQSSNFINNNFVYGLNIGELRIATTPCGEFQVGLVGNGLQALTGNLLSGFFSSFYRLNNAGLPAPSKILGFAPTGYNTPGNFLNSLSTDLTSFAAGTTMPGGTTASGLCTYVAPQAFDCQKYHAISTWLANEGYYIIEVLSSLATPDRLSRGADSVQNSHQHGGNFNP